MFPAGFRNRLIGMAAVVVAVPLGFAAAYTASNFACSDAPLQRLADEAALAGVNSLAASVGQPEDQRVEASVAAARQVLSARQSAIRLITTSTDGLKLSVVLNDPENHARASATARYIPPSDGYTAQAAAGLPVSLADSRARM